MIRFVHPCGHEDEIDERRWYDEGGDAPWPCPTCEEAREQERQANAPFLSPLGFFLHSYGPLVDRLPNPEYGPDSWEMDEAERAEAARIEARLVALRAGTVLAIERGLELRAAELAKQGAKHPYPRAGQQEPWDAAALLRNLEAAYQRLHNNLWCAENGLQPWEGADAFWLFDVRQAEERLVAEMWRRVHRRQEAAHVR